MGVTLYARRRDLEVQPESPMALILPSLGAARQHYHAHTDYPTMRNPPLKLRQNLDGLLDRNRGVKSMNIVEVQIVNSKAFETSFYGHPSILWRVIDSDVVTRVIWLTPDFQSKLRG